LLAEQFQMSKPNPEATNTTGFDRGSGLLNLRFCGLSPNLSCGSIAN